MEAACPCLLLPQRRRIGLEDRAGSRSEDRAWRRAEDGSRRRSEDRSRHGKRIDGNRIDRNWIRIAAPFKPVDQSAAEIDVVCRDIYVDTMTFGCERRINAAAFAVVCADA